MFSFLVKLVSSKLFKIYILCKSSLNSPPPRAFQLKFFKAFIKPFEAPQRSVKTKTYVNFIFSSNIRTGRNKLPSFHGWNLFSSPRHFPAVTHIVSINLTLVRIPETQLNIYLRMWHFLFLVQNFPPPFSGIICFCSVILCYH